jgi:8-oxo-dGTP diphosphatase
MINVTAAIIAKGNKVLIAKRNSIDRLANMWEFPGGKLENGESPEECLKRELYEELGIDTVIGEFLGETIHHYDHISVRLMFYRTQWIDGKITPVVHDNVVFVGIDEIGDYDFAPADIPFVNKIKERHIDL